MFAFPRSIVGPLGALIFAALIVVFDALLTVVTP